MPQNHDHSSTIQATASFEQGNGLFPPVKPGSLVPLLPRLTSEDRPISILLSLYAWCAIKTATRCRYTISEMQVSVTVFALTEPEQAERCYERDFFLRLGEEPAVLSVVHHDTWTKHLNQRVSSSYTWTCSLTRRPCKPRPAPRLQSVSSYTHLFIIPFASALPIFWIWASNPYDLNGLTCGGGYESYKQMGNHRSTARYVGTNHCFEISH